MNKKLFYFNLLSSSSFEGSVILNRTESAPSSVRKSTGGDTVLDTYVAKKLGCTPDSSAVTGLSNSNKADAVNS